MSYYIANDGLQRGPLEKHQLLAAGLRADTLVWSEGMADWQPAHQVQELREVLGGARAATPPPPPPPTAARGGYSAAPQGYPRVQGYPPPYSAGDHNRVAAGICAILFGGFGVHKFILGRTGAGLLMLLLSTCTCLMAYPIMHVIGIIEGIIYLTKSDEEFYQLYVVQKKSWF